MDIVLHNEVKEMIENKYKVFVKHFASDFSENSYSTALSKVVAFSSVLQLFQEKYIAGEVEYQLVKTGLNEFSEHLINLAVLLKYQQQKNIDFTNQALNQSDSSGYLQEEKLMELGNNLEEKGIIALINAKVNIENLMDKTANRYTEKFGEFDSLKLTKTILEKEFDDSKEYLKFLEAITNIKFKKTNNLSPLIEAVSSMAYESVQLSAVIKRAEKFLKLSPLAKKEYKPTYIILDGISSTQYLKDSDNYYEALKEKTQILNNLIAKSDNMQLLCNFATYKQDEVHGVINGNFEEFALLAEKVFAPYPFRIGYSDKEISNIEKTPYGVPFDLYGPACTAARRKLQAKQDVIEINLPVMKKEEDRQF